MEKPDFITDGQERTWSNAFTTCFSSALFITFGGMFIHAFIDNQKYYGSLIVGLLIWLLGYEIAVNAFIRIHYLDGELLFLRPLRKYSLFFRKRKHQMRIRPEEWTQVYRYSFKGGKSYYFRNGQTAAYFVSTDGLGNFFSDIKTLFPGRVKENLDFPRDTKRRLRKEFPERVF